MKMFQLLVATTLLLSSAMVLAEKPDPVNNPPLQIREQNLDADGLIAVHEQGTAKVEVQGVADVNVTGGSLDVTIADNQEVEVTNTVDVHVDNIPSEQAVFINAGELSSVSRVYSDEWTLEPSETLGPHYFVGGPIHATTIHISDSDHETAIEFGSAQAPGTYVLLYTDFDAVIPILTDSFAYPIPLESVRVTCKNESDTCKVTISVFGF